MTNEPKDASKLIEKMRANTERQQRHTLSRPAKRIRKKVPKTKKK